ncbi:RNA modification enzyme, MiaB family [Pyrolobus fumarii 1A]|uniref:tRNA-t(6)A37 methylthiotransferase n=1 Tax=Pyrolobus fumarii (strain DSM 11204 / 1A) TaxID=694429 RepID=G0EE87_PYRF1|nr:RNA modification enzyme, MiaB family [Pyrolobus fumarii 1A]
MTVTRVYIETYGCALNHADSAIMSSVLASRGYTIVDSIEDADVIIINTCTVRLDTEQRMVKRIKEVWRKYGKSKRIVIAGCLAKAQPYLVKRVAPGAVLVSPGNVHRIYLAVESGTELLVEDPLERKRLPPRPWKHGVVAEVVIQEGCLSDCAFCITKFARRYLRSQPIEEIVDYVKKLVEAGVVEIRLTGQDTATYGVDIYGKRMLPKLLEEIASVVESPDGCKAYVRVGMMSPDQALPFWDELLDIMSHPCIFKFLHIPVQSGDDRVLRVMRREYTVDEYRRMVYEARSKLPGVTIATDIIVGHPGEDEEAFENTVRLVEELLFERVHLAQYTPRPRTLAARLPQVPDPVKKERSRRLQRVIEDVGYRVHASYVGANALLVVTEEGSEGTLVARTHNYMQVILPPGSANLGSTIEAKIVGATWYDLRAVPVGMDLGAVSVVEQREHGYCRV